MSLASSSSSSTGKKGADKTTLEYPDSSRKSEASGKSEETSRVNHFSKGSRKTSKKGRFVWEYRVSAKDFMNETSTAEREVLRELLNDSILHFLTQKKSVYLEKFGILNPVVSDELSSHLSGNHCIVRKDHMLRVVFEKCSELIQLHRDHHPSIVELQELTGYLYAHLPLEFQVKWSEKLTRRFVRGLISSIRNEVIVDGYSKQLYKVGEFFSVHNRQGEGASDWYAGANILLHPFYSSSLKAEICSRFEQPELDSPCELLQAAYGDPISVFSLDLSEELEGLGYDREVLISELPEEERKIDLMVFRRENDGGTPTIIYCTDGLRETATPEASEGVEFTVQVRSTDICDGEEQLATSTEVASFPRKLLALGWIFLQTRKDKSLPIEVGLSAESPLTDLGHQQIAGIFTTHYSPVALPQRTPSGRFRYLNIVGVTEDELRYSELRSSSHLLSLLKCRSLDQVSVPGRSSLFSKGLQVPLHETSHEAESQEAPAS